MSTFRYAFLSLALAAALAFPAAAAQVNQSLAQVLQGIKATNKTEIGETSAEISQVNLGYVIKGGGALILCEGAGGTNGPNGGCKDNTAASASDLLAFIANGSNEDITLYSDPTLNNISLNPADLKKAFGPTLAYLQEGWYYDERTGNFGLITNDNGVSVYIKKGKGFLRAFIVRSDTVEVPEPGAWAIMLLGAAIAGAALRRTRARACLS